MARRSGAVHRVIAIPTRQARAWLLVFLAVEMCVAAYLRWPLTTAAIQTQFEYQLGQVVITSENWHREGMFARHLLPTRSTDPGLTEWSSYDQDYVTVPPLSFVAHYGAARMFPRVEPVFLAKIVAQLQIAGGLLIAAALLYATFSFWPTLLALSFLIWTTPFLVWFINGYFPTTTALLVQLVFIAWLLPPVRRWANGRDTVYPRELWIGAGLAALGACTEALDLALTACVCGSLVAMGVWPRNAHRPGRSWFALAGAVAAGALGMIAVLVALYASITDFGATFADRLARRSGTYYGRAGVVAHAEVIWRQLQTAWPRSLLLFLASVGAVVVLWSLWNAVPARAGRSRRSEASVVVVALLLGLGPSLAYHYLLQNHVTIHWWFSGTWAVGAALIVAAGGLLARRLFFAVWPDRRMLQLVYPATCAALAATSTSMYAGSTDLPRWSAALATEFPMDVYRDLGERLPRDGFPLVATHFADPDLFTQYPFATAYVRRPIVLLENGVFTLPWGGTPADIGRLRREKYAYVAYNPFGRRCRGEPVPIGERDMAWMRVCRVEMAMLLDRRDSILEPRSAAESVEAAHGPSAFGDPPQRSAESRQLDRLLADLRADVARGAHPRSRAEVMALVRVIRTRAWSDDTFLRQLQSVAEDAPQLAEPLALLRAELETAGTGPSSSAAVIIGGHPAGFPIDMHGDANLEGRTVTPGPSGYNEVTVYFRPLREWNGRQLWFHAYPEGSGDYVSIAPSPSAFAGWKSGELAWESFLLPADTRFNAFVGVGVGETIGPPYPLGWVPR